jgi:hypothetical protein
MHVSQTSEAQKPAEKPVSKSAIGRPGQRPILALAVFALGLNAAAAVYTTSPADFALPNVGALAELLPHQRGSDPAHDQVVAALKDIQSAQQSHVASLQANSFAIQQGTDLLKQETTDIAILRRTITDQQSDVKLLSAQIAVQHGDTKGDLKNLSAQLTDEHADVKKVSDQVAALTAKVDALQNSLSPQFTSSISTGRAHYLHHGPVHTRMARRVKPVGPLSAPLTLPGFDATPAE